MMKTKRTYTLLTVFLISGLALFGCGVSEDAETSPSTGAVFQTQASTTPSTSTTAETSEPTQTEATVPTEPKTEPETELSTEVSVTPETEPPTEAPTILETEPPTKASLTIDNVAFVGDSRTLTMATGGRYEFGLIPSSSVFATWGGELTQDSARQNALAAASADHDLAIFWYGINDVQSDPEQKLAPQFVANYEAIIDLYRDNNPDGEIVILSILSTSVHEKDYYAGQEENIRTYNAELAALCAENGYTYLDITSLFTGDECLAEGDYIHFSKEWYSQQFLPTVCGALNITY